MSALAKSISRVAWSYVFLYLDVNIGVDGGSLNLLPDFICYVLILYALPGLAIEERSAALLRPLAWILLVVEAVRWVLPVIGLTPASLGRIPAGPGRLCGLSVLPLPAPDQYLRHSRAL